jgi:RNase P/RNase MRP subunit p29
VLARLNEHAADRKEITVDPNSDDPREKPVVAGQRYHFKVERTDGKTVRWWIDGNEMLSYPDPRLSSVWDTTTSASTTGT